MDVEKIGFVTGLTAEMALLKDTAFLRGAGGGTPEGAADVATRLLDKGAKALISFGLAGGLNPVLAPGAIMVPETVVEAGESYICDPGLVAWLGGASCAAIFAGEAIAVTVSAKAAIFAANGADAIDLESGAVARVAASYGVPFAVLRAVCDPAPRNLPPAAVVALNTKGRIGGLRILASVLRRPGQLPSLFRLSADAAAARNALKRRLKVLDRFQEPLTM